MHAESATVATMATLASDSELSMFAQKGFGAKTKNVLKLYLDESAESTRLQQPDSHMHAENAKVALMAPLASDSDLSMFTPKV